MIAHLANRWTPEMDARLLALVDAGISDTDIAVAFGKSRNAVALRRRRLRPFARDGYVPAFGTSMGPVRYWTGERIRTGLEDFAARYRGKLPTSDHVYNAMKKGHPEWPTGGAILREFGSMANAWDAIGASRRRVSRNNNEWTAEDNDYLLQYAGTKTLKLIGGHLGRTAAACKRQLYNLQAGRARDVSGYLSAMQVAVEYNCPLHRVKDLIASGELRAKKVQGGHYWRIDPGDCERIRAKLTAPKKTHVSVPPDFGDYNQRYGMRRAIVNGKVARVPAGIAS